MGRTAVTEKVRIRCTPGVDVGARIKGIYEGASLSPRMGIKGLVGVGGPNADLQRSLPNLVRRSRHADRNNPYASAASNTYADNMVGNGISAIWPNEQMQAIWDRWMLLCDADGQDNFYGQQRLVACSQFTDGEVLARRRIRWANDPLPVPLQIQLMEADHLDLDKTLVEPDRRITMGVEFSAWGQRQAYHLWPYHPGDVVQMDQLEPMRVPASEILHIYRRQRPGQVRGVPELSPILIRLYEIDEMQDSTLVKQKTAQLFGWIVKKRSYDPELPREGNLISESGGTSVNKATGEVTQIERITAGGIHYLDEDEDVTFSSPDGIGANYVEWLKTELRACAKAVGLTYEQFTGDLSGVNYSSIRAGLLEFRRRIEHLQRHLLVYKFCHPVAQWVAEMAVINGRVDLPNYWADPYAHLPKWLPPKWDAVDPLKDATSDLIEVRAGFASRQDKVAERNRNIDEVDAQLFREQGSQLVLDSDPSKVNKSGVLHAALEIIKQSEDEDG